MAYSVDLEYTLNEDFSNPQTISESGQPSAMTLQGLQASQTYYTKAVLKNDGVVEDESQMTSFQTLQAGTITLNHYQTTRSGYAYDVTYLYSSTYAPSWCTLSVNGSTFQGAINSGNNTVSFHVTGLTAGTAYLTSVTMGDIYAETSNVQGSIVATVVNEITITNIDSGFTSVDVDVEYIIDGGYSTGWIDYWDASGDPSTDQPEGHEVLYNGAETVTVGNLTEGTAYKFRATIILADGTTRIDSNVVNVSTNVNYATKYFTITSLSSSNNIISYRTGSNQTFSGIEVSTNGGTSWTSIPSGTSGNLAILRGVGESVLIRHTGAMWTTSTIRCRILSSNYISVSGNIASLTHGSNFVGTKSLPDYGLKGVLGSEYLRDASNLSFASYNSIGKEGCYQLFSGSTRLLNTPTELPATTLGESCYEYMFQGCTSLTTTPSLPATTMAKLCYSRMFNGCTSLTVTPELPATTLEYGCYYYMFSGCTSLTTTPELPATTLAQGCYQGMFEGCTSLVDAPDLPATSLAIGCYYAMFYGCSSLENIPELSATTLAGSCYYQMFSNCTSLETPPDLPATTLASSCYYQMFKFCTALADVPKIAATTMAQECCGYMFHGCTAIENGIDLKSVTRLEKGCFKYMYYDCSRLTEAYAPSVSSWDANQTSNWLYGVAAEGVVYKPSDLTIPTDSVSGVPSGWTTQDY